MTARIWGRGAVVAAALLGVFFMLRPSRPVLAQTESCIDSWNEARYSGVGYNHVVSIRNRCDRTATCEVWTDVNPDHQRVTVEPNEVREVLTFLGSPARVFTAHADCKLGD
jgi:hypothetical protein